MSTTSVLHTKLRGRSLTKGYIHVNPRKGGISLKTLVTSISQRLLSDGLMERLGITKISARIHRRELARGGVLRQECERWVESSWCGRIVGRNWRGKMV